MKKIVITLITLVGLAIQTNGQTLKPISVGVKAGVTLATSSIDQYEMAFGLASGIIVDYNFSKNLFVRSGLDFMMKGGKLDTYNEQTGTANSSVLWNDRYSRIHLNYLQIPLMIGYRTSVTDQVNLFATGGVYGAYGVFGSGKYRLTTNIPGGKNESTSYDSFSDLELKKFDFGLVGSFGVEYGPSFISIGYEYGLINANKTRFGSSSTGFTNGDSWHNMNATCTLGYMF